VVFSGAPFLLVFLPLALLLYFVSPWRLRNGVLLAASLVFYTWGGGELVALLVLSIAANHVLGLLARGGGREGSGPGARPALAVAGCVAVNLGILAYFKYANFFVEQVNALGAAPVIDWSPVALPIGISFYTFQSMSYVFDVARGDCPPRKSPLDFGLYVSMFPQLIAGPIVRYREIAGQITRRRTGLDDLGDGAARFALGLVKKVVVADAAGAVADAAFAVPAGEVTTASAWIGAGAYTLQIYFDFSAYSDMAIGLGRILGFRLPENFDRPYSAVSLTDFWRRWHITLSTWFRDYLYVPLGGSRGSTARTHLNLWIVFLATGLWHGAAWTFVCWGIYHGALLIAERVTGLRAAAGWAAPRRALTLLLVIVGWVLFRADDLGHARGLLGAMFAPDGGDLPVDLRIALSTKNVLTMGLASGVALLPASFRAGVLVESGRGPAALALRIALLCVGLPYALVSIASGTYSPFLYFQF
jgi:alginate O-acetyltransferase complex protein AlgI